MAVNALWLQNVPATKWMVIKCPYDFTFGDKVTQCLNVWQMHAHVIVPKTKWQQKMAATKRHKMKLLLQVFKLYMSEKEKERD